jgi:photosystem II stability/assembly factor-like uncharacterized protein
MDHNTPHIQPVTTQLRIPHRLIGTIDRVPHSSRSHRDEWDIRAKHEPLSFPHRKHLLALAILIAATLPAQAQWDIQESHTTASLRGIHNVGGGVAWASGTEGTVLRTEDGGYLWQGCAIPPGAEKLDFRGIQAFDENTAIVMSSGKGDLSRLYKTTDGCRTWKLIFTNPDGPDNGFFDTILFLDRKFGLVFGDPAHGSVARNPVEGGYFAFRIRVTDDGGDTWGPVSDPEAPHPGANLMPVGNEGLFAASNSSAAINDGWLWIGTGGSRVLKRLLYRPSDKVPTFNGGFCAGAIDPSSHRCGLPWLDWSNTVAPMATSGPAAGIFSLHFISAVNGVAVGGDYSKPNESSGVAAFTRDGSKTWQSAQTQPQGYRSAVAYDPTTKTWITVGPNGTDISRDDGRNWSPLKPTATEPQDADKNWNALSLPFVVGPKGRIGKFRDNVIPTALKK